MLYITSEKELDLKSGLSVIYFYTSWFIWHSTLAKLLTTIKEEMPNIKFYAVDLDWFPSYIAKYSLKKLPTIKITKHEGYVVKTYSNMDTIENLKPKVRDIEQAYNQEISNAQR